MLTLQAYQKPDDLFTWQHRHSSKHMRGYFDHRPEIIGVALAGSRFHLMVRQPLILDVGAESLTATSGISHPAFGHLGLGPLPGLVRRLLVRVGTR